MSSNWSEVKLGEIATFKYGKFLPKKDLAEEGYPVFSGYGVVGYLPNYRFEYEQLVVVCRGVGGTGDIKLSPPFCSITNLAIIISCNESKVDKGFLYWALKFSDTYSLRTGSAQPQIVVTSLETYKISIPDSLAEQRKIAEVLFSFESKIELNRQINQTLEQIAQAIFKSWFVDFDPVKAKVIAREKGGNELARSLAAQAILCGACTLEQLEQLPAGCPVLEDQIHPLIVNRFPDENSGLDYWQPEQLASTAALFPSEFVDSELGEMPKGWSVKTFGDVSQCFDSKRIPLSKKKREEKKPGNIPYYGATSIMDYVNEWVFDDIYLLLGEDGSVIKADGTPFVQYIWGKTWVNNHAHVLQGKNGVSTEQLMMFIQNKNIAAYITGAVQLKLNQGNMNSIPFLDSGEVINLRFHDIIKPLYEKVRNISEENQTLTITRDALLPKLLSGEFQGTEQDIFMDKEIA